MNVFLQNEWKRRWISNTSFKKCFRITRPTQVEELADPFKDGSDGFYSTNVVAAGLYWNVISTITAIFLYFVHLAQDDDGSATRHVFLSQNPKWMLTILIVSIISACLFGTPCFLMSGPGHIAAFVLPIFLFGFFVIACAIMAKNKAALMEKDVDKWIAVKITSAIVFWIGFTVVLPVIVTAGNMLSQKRDFMQVVHKIIMSAGIGLGCLAAETTYYAATTKIATSKVSGQDVSKETTIKNFSYKLKKKKDDILSDILKCIVLQMVGIFCSDFATFPQTQYSNANKAASLISIPMLMLVAFLHILRLLFKSTSLEEVLIDKEVDTKNWTVQLAFLDLAARLVFTICLWCDLQSTGNSDNIGLNNVWS